MNMVFNVFVYLFWTIVSFSCSKNIQQSSHMNLKRKRFDLSNEQPPEKKKKINYSNKTTDNQNFLQLYTEKQLYNLLADKNNFLNLLKKGYINLNSIYDSENKKTILQKVLMMDDEKNTKLFQKMVSSTVYKIDTSLKNKYGNNIFHYICSSFSGLEPIQTKEIDLTIDLYEQNNQGYYPLTFAIYKNNIELISCLLNIVGNFLFFTNSINYLFNKFENYYFEDETIELLFKYLVKKLPDIVNPKQIKLFEENTIFPVDIIREILLYAIDEKINIPEKLNKNIAKYLNRKEIEIYNKYYKNK